MLDSHLIVRRIEMCKQISSPMSRVVDWKVSQFSAPAVIMFADSMLPDNWGQLCFERKTSFVLKNLAEHLNPKVVLWISKGSARVFYRLHF